MKRQEKRSLLILFATGFFLFASSPFVKALTSDWDYYLKYGDRSERWDPLVEAGFEAFEGGNLSAAIQFLKRAKIFGCKDGLLFFKLGAFEELQGNFDSAILLFKEAEPLLTKQYKNHPATLEFDDHLGGLYYQMEQYEEALTRYLKAIKNNRENFLRLFLTGQIYRMKGETAKAITHFEKSLQHDPPETPPKMKLLAKTELLRLYHEAKSEEKMLEMIEQILAEDPSNAAAIEYKEAIQRRKSKENEKKKWEEILEKYQ